MRFLAAVLVLIMAAGICLGQERLTLDQSIQIALEKSPVMLKARAEIIAAEGMAGQATAGFLPQLSLNASLGKYYSEPQTMQVDMTGTGSPSAVSFGVDEEADTTSYSASLTQALFTGGKLQISLAMDNKGLEIAKEELRKISEEVKFNVINAYYGVSRAQKFVELSEQSVKMAKTHLDRVNALLKVGMSTKADLLRVEVQVAQAEMGLTKAKQGLEIARNNFNNTLGRDLDARVELAEVKYESAEITIYDYKELLKIAYEDRPDWRQYVLAKQVSEDEVGVAKSGLWPMLSLVGSYDIGSTKYPSYQSDTKTWTAMLSGSWNIFDGTATWNKIKEAKAKVDAQRANETSVKRAVALEVKDANFAVQSAKDNLAAARKARELAEENLEIAELRYDSGVGTNLEVIDAQLALTQSRTDYLQAQHDLQIAQARINKVVGSKIY
jgi:outer membrane protein